MPKKNLLLISLIILLIGTFIGIFLLNRTSLPDNSMQPVSYPNDFTLSQPISYLQKNRFLQDSEMLEQRVIENSDCLVLQNGIEVYSIKDNLNKSFVVNRRGLQSNATETEQFENALKSILDLDVDLQVKALSTSCGGQGFAEVKRFEFNYLNAEKALVIIALGGFQATFPSVEHIDMTTFIYGVKDNSIFLAREKFKASDIVSENEGAACLVGENENYKYIDPYCLAGLIKSNPTKDYFFVNKASELSKSFQLYE